MVITSTFHKSGKRSLPLLILATEISISAIKQIKVRMIGTDTYYALYRLKRVQVFTRYIKDLKYKTKNKVRLKTNPSSVIPEKYQDHLDVFSKKNSDILLPYQKYDQKIVLEKK